MIDPDNIPDDWGDPDEDEIERAREAFEEAVGHRPVRPSEDPDA